jgi:hypothetical protein
MHLVQRERRDDELAVAGEHPVRCEVQQRTRFLAQGDQEDDPLGRQPPRRKRQRSGGRPVEPLHVVDRHEYRPLAGKGLNHAQEAERHSALVDRPRCRHLEHQGRAQRVRLRRRQLADRVQPVRQQVTDARVRELRLGLEGPGCKHGTPVRLRSFGTGTPEGRLAGSRLSRQQERTGRAVGCGDERRDRCELAFPADDLELHVTIVARSCADALLR